MVNLCKYIFTYIFDFFHIVDLSSGHFRDLFISGTLIFRILQKNMKAADFLVPVCLKTPHTTL